MILRAHARTGDAHSARDESHEVVVGTRPSSATIQAWRRDVARRGEIGAFVDAKGVFRLYEVALCVLYWLERHDGTGPSTAATPTRPVSAAAIEARYPLHAGRRLRAVAPMLGRLASLGIVESVGEGWYHTTPLGRAIVDALPDRAILVHTLGTRPPRGRSGAAP